MMRAVAFRFAASLWVLPVAFGMGCGGDDETEHDDDHGDHDHEMNVGPDSGAECPDDSTLTYANFGKEFFSKYCLSCHSEQVTGDKRMGAPADHNFDKLSQIELLKKHIDQMAASGPAHTNETMPKTNPKPTLDERKKLGEWLACDVPE